MGWSIGWNERWQRDIGYGVPAYCDHPRCNETIDRGLSYVCADEPFGGDEGCGLYFCEKHRCHYKHEHSMCLRCFRNAMPFTPKGEHPKWVKHLETHSSWAEWRQEHKNRKWAVKSNGKVKQFFLRNQ